MRDSTFVGLSIGAENYILDLFLSEHHDKNEPIIKNILYY